MSIIGAAQDMLAGIHTSEARWRAPMPMLCCISNGTYDATTDTACVWIQAEMVNYDADGNLIPAQQFGPYPIARHHYGEQSGPNGGEQCYVFPVEGGGIIQLAGFKDAFANWGGVQASEWRMLHPQHPTSYFYLKNDGTNWMSAEGSAVVIAPQVFLGESQSSGNDGIVRYSDLQTVVNNVIQAVQNAFDTVIPTLEAGSGGTPPTVQSVQSQSSRVSFSA